MHQKRLLKFCVLLITLGLQSACHPGKNEKQEGGSTYNITYDSYLYFKNVRRLYYNEQSLEAANLKIYRLKEAVDDEAEGQIRFSIVVNVKSDHAYLMTEPCIGLDSVTHIYSEHSLSNTIDTLEIARGDREAHYAFANALYSHILDGNSFWYHDNSGDKISVLEQKKAREIIRITIYDYFRLVNLR